MSRKKERRNEAEDIAAAAADEDNPASIFNAALKLHNSGRFNDAYPLYEKALKRFEGLLEAYPENTQFQFKVAMTQSNLGALLTVMGRQEEAKARFERALELYEKLLKSDPENTAFQSDVAAAQNNLGNLFQVMGRQEEAKARYERALEMHEKLLKSNLKNTQFQFKVAMTQNNLGTLLSVMGRQEEAKARYERALELVKEQKNPHYIGWTLALLGKLELDKDEPDLETAQSFLEASVEQLPKDIRPGYPKAVNLFALCYYKRGEQTRREARKEKGKNRIKQLAKESSQFYTLAAANYRKAYELPYAQMPTALLIDAYLADTFSRSVHVIAEADDRKATEILTESIERIQKAVELAKENEEQRKRVEGAWHDLEAKQCIRSVSLFTGEPETQEQLLGDAVDHLIQAALNFEELHADKTAASCQGCACLYNGLKKFKDGIMSDTLQLIAEAHEEFKRASEFYQAAESDVGADVISAINAVIPELETCRDNWTREERKPKIAEYLPIYAMINNLIEQVSTAGLRNLFKAYIFDPFMQLVDEQKPQLKGEQTIIHMEEVVMGDQFKNIQNATIINKSIVENSFNKVNEKYGEEVANALLQIAAFIEKSKSREAGDLFDTFYEELNKPEPKKSVLKRLWEGIAKALPAIATLSDTIVKLETLFNQ